MGFPRPKCDGVCGRDIATKIHSFLGGDMPDSHYCGSCCPGGKTHERYPGGVLLCSLLDCEARADFLRVQAKRERQSRVQTTPCLPREAVAAEHVRWNVRPQTEQEGCGWGVYFQNEARPYTVRPSRKLALELGERLNEQGVPSLALDDSALTKLDRWLEERWEYLTCGCRWKQSAATGNSALDIELCPAHYGGDLRVAARRVTL